MKATQQHKNERLPMNSSVLGLAQDSRHTCSQDTDLTASPPKLGGIRGKTGSLTHQRQESLYSEIADAEELSSHLNFPKFLKIFNKEQYSDYRFHMNFVCALSNKVLQQSNAQFSVIWNENNLKDQTFYVNEQLKIRLPHHPYFHIFKAVLDFTIQKQIPEQDLNILLTQKHKLIDKIVSIHKSTMDDLINSQLDNQYKEALKKVIAKDKSKIKRFLSSLIPKGVDVVPSHRTNSPDPLNEHSNSVQESDPFSGIAKFKQDSNNLAGNKGHKIQFYTSNNFFSKQDRARASIGQKLKNKKNKAYGDSFGISRNGGTKHYLNTENLIKEESSEENYIVTEDEQDKNERQRRPQQRTKNEAMSVSPTYNQFEKNRNLDISYQDCDRVNNRTPLLDQYNNQMSYQRKPVSKIIKQLKESSNKPLENGQDMKTYHFLHQTNLKNFHWNRQNESNLDSERGEQKDFSVNKDGSMQQRPQTRSNNCRRPVSRQIINIENTGVQSKKIVQAKMRNTHFEGGFGAKEFSLDSERHISRRRGIKPNENCYQKDELRDSQINIKSETLNKSLIFQKPTTQIKKHPLEDPSTTDTSTITHQQQLNRSIDGRLNQIKVYDDSRKTPVLINQGDDTGGIKITRTNSNNNQFLNGNLSCFAGEQLSPPIIEEQESKNKRERIQINNQGSKLGRLSRNLGNNNFPKSRSEQENSSFSSTQEKFYLGKAGTMIEKKKINTFYRESNARKPGDVKLSIEFKKAKHDRDTIKEEGEDYSEDEDFSYLDSARQDYTCDRNMSMQQFHQTSAEQFIANSTVDRFAIRQNVSKPYGGNQAHRKNEDNIPSCKTTSSSGSIGLVSNVHSISPKLQCRNGTTIEKDIYSLNPIKKKANAGMKLNPIKDFSGVKNLK